MKIALIISLAFISFVARGQDTTINNTVKDTTKHAVDDVYDKLFTKTEIEASYPGGEMAWQRFLVKNLRYPDDAVSNEIQGTVYVQFIVDKEGNVSDISAISGPTRGGLREEAVRMVKLSGKWTPAIQNGRQVKSLKKLPLTFKLSKG